MLITAGAAAVGCRRQLAISKQLFISWVTIIQIVNSSSSSKCAQERKNRMSSSRSRWGALPLGGTFVI